MLPRKIAVVLLLIVIATACGEPEAQVGRPPVPNGSKDLEKVILDSKILDQAPGFAVGVLLNGEPVLLKGFGKSNLELDTPATEHSVFPIGSLSKPLTATIVMKLVEEGKLKLGDPLTKFLPDLPDYCKGVTIRHMLNHTSGIPNYNSAPGFMKKEMAGIDAEDVFSIVRNAPPNFKVGQKWEYSNTNYWLLGVIIGEVTGGFYGDAVKKMLTDPAGMPNSGFLMHMPVVKGRADGYTRGPNEPWKNARLPVMTGPFAAGGLSVSAADMLEFDKALSSGKLISEESLAAMLEPTKLADGESRAYGFGWTSGVLHGERYMDGGGGVPGFVSAFRRFRDKQLSIVVLANGNGASVGALVDLLSKAVEVAKPR